MISTKSLSSNVVKGDCVDWCIGDALGTFPNVTSVPFVT
jgi:hypothetical protein